MPDRWTLPRVVNRIHRDILAPLGFARRGNRCVRSDNGLSREIWFTTPPWGDPATKGVNVQVIVRIAGLPEPLTEFRRDNLWTFLGPVNGMAEYPRPPSADPPPRELVEDVAGPGVDFLCHAADLLGFAAWAREIYGAGGAWGPFRIVYPGGTAPLQAAALAAARAGDAELSEQAVAAVRAQERDRRWLRDFQTELHRIAAVDQEATRPV